MTTAVSVLLVIAGCPLVAVASVRRGRKMARGRQPRAAGHWYGQWNRCLLPYGAVGLVPVGLLGTGGWLPK